MHWAMTDEYSGEFEDIFDTGRQATRWVPELSATIAPKDAAKTSSDTRFVLAFPHDIYDVRLWGD